MFNKVVTKQKEELWLWKERPVLGRREIANLQFEKYLLKNEKRGTK